MALSATRLDEYTLAYSKSNLDAWEHRHSSYGVLATYQKDTPNLIPGYAELVANRPQQLRTVRIPVIDRKDVTTGSARTCTAQTHELTSAYVTPSWTSYQFGINMVPAEYSFNHLSYQDAFNNKMAAAQRTVLAAFDTLAHTNLNANITSVIAADGNPYTAAANALVVPAADNELYFNELGAIMSQDDFPDTGINVVASPRTKALVMEMGAQGPNNAENRGFQFSGYDFAFSNRVTRAGTDRDTVFAMPPASLAFMTDIDPDSRAGHVSSDGSIWSTMTLPMLGWEVGVLYKSTCSNQGVSGTARATGLEATLSESWSFSFDYSFNVAYNSDSTTYAGPIHKARFTKA